MTCVIDASVAIKWFIEENLHGEALDLLYALGGSIEAPDFVLVEVGNIAWKKAMRGELQAEKARTLSLEARGFLALVHRSEILVHRAIDIALSLQHPVYDCLYLACAEYAGAPLVTADHRLVRAVADTEFQNHVQMLGAYGPLH